MRTIESMVMTFEFKPRLYSTFNLKKKSICWTPFLRGSLGSQVSGKCQKNGSRIKFTISYQHNLLGQVILLLIYKKKKKNFWDKWYFINVGCEIYGSYLYLTFPLCPSHLPNGSFFFFFFLIGCSLFIIYTCVLNC